MNESIDAAQALPRVPKPKRLGKPGSALWRRVTSRYTLRPDEARLLEDACREADLIETLDEALRTSPLMVKGSTGQDIVNPLVSELRQHRSVMKSLMTALKLPDDGNEKGNTAGDRSAQARAAAQARWARRGA